MIIILFSIGMDLRDIDSDTLKIEDRGWEKVTFLLDMQDDILN
jgi:hypothetical protein